MSQYTPEKEIYKTEHSKPAIGLIATRENEAELTRTILQATRQGYDVLVTHGEETEPEAVDLARMLDARIVYPDHADTDWESLVSTLAVAARTAGYPGLIYQSSDFSAIDYAQSETDLTEGTGFAVEAVPTNAVRQRPSIVIGVPAYNEAGSIEHVVEAAKKYGDRVFVVDDGSRDDTALLAREAGADVIEHEYNRGYGAALKTLFRAADRQDARHLVVLDADDQHDPADIPRLVAAQRESDTEIVIGSRFGDGAATDIPRYRRLGLFVVNTLTNMSIGAFHPSKRISDTQSGFRAYNRRAIAGLADDETIGSQMNASTDILYHAHQRGYGIEEVGIRVRYDVANASSHDPISHGYNLVNNISTTVQNTHPLISLGTPGVLSIVLGISGLYWLVSVFLATGSLSFALTALSALFCFGGFFACIAAVILHSLKVSKSR
ncbi:MAG: glycosyltransferase family 2 protein [Halalkalicoccus sp.]|nr:glycosyltransferase family 2 protein [Halalkalicoccus sp.]